MTVVPTMLLRPILISSRYQNSDVATEETNECPIGNAKLAKEQGVRDVFGTGGHHGKGEAGADLILLAVPQDDAANVDAESF